jgi:hypothetical protein
LQWQLIVVLGMFRKNDTDLSFSSQNVVPYIVIHIIFGLMWWLREINIQNESFMEQAGSSLQLMPVGLEGTCGWESLRDSHSGRLQASDTRFFRLSFDFKDKNGECLLSHRSGYFSPILRPKPWAAGMDPGIYDPLGLRFIDKITLKLGLSLYTKSHLTCSPALSLLTGFLFIMFLGQIS